MNLIKIYLLSLFVVFFITSCSKDHYLGYDADSELSLPFINISVNNTNCRAYIDTGMQSNALISKLLLEKIGGNKLLDKKRYKDADGEVFYTYRYKTNLKFFGEIYNDLIVDGIEMLTIGQDSDGTFMKLPLTHQNIIGLNLLKKRSFILNLRNNFISFDMEDVRISKNCKQIIFPFKITENGIEIKFESNNKVISAVVDTGCSGSVLREKSRKRLASYVKKTNNKYTINSLQHKSYIIPEFPCEIMEQKELDVDLLLGCDFLRQYICIFDFENNLFKLISSEIPFTGCGSIS